MSIPSTMVYFLGIGVNILLTLLLVLNPTHINVSHNAFYDALMISIIIFCFSCGDIRTLFVWE